MARKSNKTTHVLNLLSGYDDKEKTASESQNTESAANKTAEKPTASLQNISVIDKTEDDALAHLIQEELTKELENSLPEEEASKEEAAAEPVIETVPEPTMETEPVAKPVVETAPEPAMETAPEPTMETEPVPEPTEAAPVKKQPDFVILNIMEEVVKDKIIYFMRQFDVCTCDRCIADTTALALNGLAPKYIVTTPAAVDPLLSFYTNKFISDITVEATKACMVIKDNPRH